jgi:hypothetical protein
MAPAITVVDWSFGTQKCVALTGQGGPRFRPQARTVRAQNRSIKAYFTEGQADSLAAGATARLLEVLGKRAYDTDGPYNRYELLKKMGLENFEQKGTKGTKGCNQTKRPEFKTA